MKFKQEAKTGKIVIFFSWKERIKLLFKPTITLSFEGSKHAINHLIRCLMEERTLNNKARFIISC